jgi:NAD(P)-dependent dehydrogenase (short-subunit alcohol dehydrogenase family)
MPRTLTGLTVLVTGANRGIGSAFVEAVLEAGADRVYACAREPRSLEAAMHRQGARLIPVELDVTDPAHVDRACAAVRDVDLLVSNAGREGSGRVLGHDEAEARDLFEVHLWGPWRLADALAPVIRERAGGMIFVQSIAAMVLSRRGPFYSASKAAATMMAAALRESMREDGVTVTNVFPGFTDTDMMAAEDVPKASPRQTADRALAGWAAGEASVYPDRFARLIHDRMTTGIDEVLARPGRVVTEEYLRYVAGGDAT